MPIAEPPVIAAFQDLAAFDLKPATASGGMDLRAIKPRCAPAAGGEIVVCAPDPEKERLRALPDTFVADEALPRARRDLGGGADIGVRLDQQRLGGVQSNRVMVDLNFKF
ncbi:hypothetical protein [Novosphingobium sp. Leaf2]|uniref:hypothetical protein n=1 Tax=Novosphingobium sp. Leaf2 TaxID=1735670 RepID=UPI0006F5A59A|nr:hypothetical protein [Novosphingobium sp. Leaf2]KQM18328.1 hypothetical protein ASE49_08915 [Novosphingobium sp. Leaf2]